MSIIQPTFQFTFLSSGKSQHVAKNIVVLREVSVCILLVFCQVIKRIHSATLDDSPPAPLADVRTVTQSVTIATRHNSQAASMPIGHASPANAKPVKPKRRTSPSEAIPLRHVSPSSVLALCSDEDATYSALEYVADSS